MEMVRKRDLANSHVFIRVSLVVKEETAMKKERETWLGIGGKGRERITEKMTIASCYTGMKLTSGPKKSEFCHHLSVH